MNAQQGNTLTRNVLFEAKQIVNIVKALEASNITVIHGVDVFRGSKAEKIIKRGDQHVEGYGAGKQFNKNDAERIFRKLVSTNVLKEKNVRNMVGFFSAYLRLGPEANSFLRRNDPFEIEVNILIYISAKIDWLLA